MKRSEQPLRRALVGMMAAIGLLTGACSNTPSWSDVKLPSASTLFPANTNTFAEAAINTNKPVAAADRVDAQGACVGAGAAPSDDASGQPASRAVSLDMTECQVIRALGTPEATELGTDARGERAVTMTYLRSDRAGLYRFVRGRLVSIERSPGAESSQPAKQSPKRGG